MQMEIDNIGEERVFEVFGLPIDQESQPDVLNSQENDSPSVSSVSQCADFKRNPWLAKHFKREEIGGKLYITCNNCNSQWKSRSIQRLIGHYHKCINSSQLIQDMEQEKEEQEQDSQDTPNMIRNRLWAEVIVENNLPLKCVESKSFKKFFKYACRPWHIPSRQELSNLYIPKLARILQLQFASDIEKGRLNHLSIEFDHWSDVNNRSYLGVIATNRHGNRYLVDLKDVSLRGHKSAVIVEDLTEILKSIPSKAINSIISDSAACCKKARQDLLNIENYKNCIQHRCLAHLLNNIGSRITTKNESIANTLKIASMVTSMVRGSTYWTAYIRDMKENALSAACRVRWYSTITMLSGLIRLKDVIVNEIAPSLSVDDQVIIENLRWNHVEEILDVLCPLNKCIGVIESKGMSLGEAFNAILQFAFKIFTDVRDSGTLVEAKKSFLWHFNQSRFGEAEFGLLLAAYALDRRYKLDYINENGWYLVLKSITRVAIISKITMRRVKACLNEDFERYRNFEDEYGTCLNQKDQVKWWTDRVSSGILSRVGIRLAYLKASSANIERTFSTIKNIQGNCRMRLLPSTLLDIARLKISYIDEPDDDELESDFDRESQQAALRELENEYNTELQSQSMNSSASSNVSSLTYENLPELPNWLENQDASTKRDYQAFFKYVDFSIINEPKKSASNASDDVCEDEIEDYIRSVKEDNRKKQNIDPDVIVESLSQTENVVYLDSTPGNALQDITTSENQ